MRTLPPLLLAVSLAACGPAVQNTAHPASATAPSSSFLTSEDITDSYLDRDVLSVIRSLRPSYLRRYGDHGAAEVVAYIDGIRVGHVTALQSLPASTVHEVRFLTGIDATNRYGMGHGSGAILVTTRSGLRR